MNKTSLLIKVASWRAVSIVSMLLTMWILTGDIQQSTGITVIVQIIQTIVHTVFESVWSKAHSGSQNENR